MPPYNKGRDHKHINGEDDNSPQLIMPPADTGSPYSENVTNISPMDVVPKATNVERVAKAIQQGYTIVSQPTCKKGPGEFPNENIRPWRPKGRKG